MNATRARRHVIVVLQGGIGNQLFQLCAGEVIRKRTGYPVAYDCEIGFRNDASSRQFELAHLIPPAQRAHPTPSNAMWRKSLQERLAVTVERNLMFRRGICSLPLNATLRMIRWWPSSEVVCRSCFQALEYVDPETVERIRGAMSLRRDGGVPEVAVHFRLTRNLNRHGRKMPEYSGTVLEMDYYREALRQVRAELGEVRFRVFSDAGVIPENVFEPGDQVMLDQPLQGEASWTTFSRIASCSHFVIANSTFSWWAAYLARSEGKQIYAPKNWRFNYRAPAQRGIFPAEWRRT